MLTESYVSFEIAKLLKEKGFNEYCLKNYWSDKELHNWKWELSYNKNSVENCNTRRYAAPTLQMALKWLREVHNIYIDILTYTTGKNIQFRWVGYDKGRLFSKEEGKIIYFDTHEQAVEAALKYTLENLI